MSFASATRSMRAEFIPQVCNTLRVVHLHGFGGMASSLTFKSLWRHTFSQRHLSLYRLPLFFAWFFNRSGRTAFVDCAYYDLMFKDGRNRNYFNMRQITAGLGWRLQKGPQKRGPKKGPDTFTYSY
jgi:hypothetical protein